MGSAKVIKVKPYPIPVHIQVGPVVMTGQIIKLVLKGFMVDTLGKVVKVGTLMQVNFELPVTKFVVTQSVKVIKTYDRPNPQTRTIDRIAECHFMSVSDEQQQNIYSFLQKIRQDDIT